LSADAADAALLEGLVCSIFRLPSGGEKHVTLHFKLDGIHLPGYSFRKILDRHTYNKYKMPYSLKSNTQIFIIDYMV